jgi:hypothetical protein
MVNGRKKAEVARRAVVRTAVGGKFVATSKVRGNE